MGPWYRGMTTAFEMPVSPPISGAAFCCESRAGHKQNTAPERCKRRWPISTAVSLTKRGYADEKALKICLFQRPAYLAAAFPAPNVPDTLFLWLLLLLRRRVERAAVCS